VKTTIEDSLGVLIVRDRSLSCPDVVRNFGRESRAHLKELAKAGNLFFIDREDPFIMSVQIVVGEEPPGKVPTELYRTVAGNYLLDLPNGALEVQGLDSWIAGDSESPITIKLEPGAYSVEALERDDHDLTEYEKYMSKLVGSDNWAFRNRVDRLYLFGCLPTVIAIALAIFAPWKLGLYAALTAAVLWLPSLILTRSKRYKTIDEKVSSTEGGLPLFVLRLRKLKDPEGIIGGYI
jgi:hypothetical protein